MDKTMAHENRPLHLEDESCTTSAPSAGKTLQLPGGIVYYHDLHEIGAGEEGGNLLDLQTRQNSVPLFSKKAKSMMGFF